MNQCRFQRSEVSSTSVRISDGINSATGVVNNVSNTGIKVHLKSEFIDPDASKFSLLLSHDSRVYKVEAIPRWWSNDHEGSKVGLRIFEAPREWFLFVDSFPQNND